MVSQYGNTYFGKSTDSKPSGVLIGRKFKEIDTSKTYHYDAAGDEWLEWVEASGGENDPGFD